MLFSRHVLNGMLLAAAVLCALSVVTSRHEARKLLLQLQDERKRAHQMDVEWGQLQLEQSTLSSPARINRVLDRQLQMQTPSAREVRVILLPQTASQVVQP